MGEREAPQVRAPSDAGTSPGLDDLLCLDLYAASRAMTATYRPLLGQHGLTYPQYLVLVALWERDDRLIKDLAEVLRLDHGTLTPLLRRLEERGVLTRRRGSDARSVRVALTAAGEALRPIADEVHCAVAEAAGLSPDRIQELRAMLRELSARLAGHAGPERA